MTPSDSKEQHKTEVLTFLQKRLPGKEWEISIPAKGTGHETYFAERGGQAYFIKLGAHTERYVIMSSLGLTPPVIESGFLPDSTSILVQQRVNARMPTRRDFHAFLSAFAGIIRQTHQSERLIQILPGGTSDAHKDAGLMVLADVWQRWEKYKTAVPSCAGFVDASIENLTCQLRQLAGHGLVASHNDICNGNWLVSQDGNIYLIDLDSMSQDDPALDLGAFLWWYYPEPMWQSFLEIAGYGNNETFRSRMRVRMAIHCLNILLPRENSFDRFAQGSFEEELEDFRAVLAGQANPKGYGVP